MRSNILILTLLLAAGCTGCSLIFVKEPSRPDPRRCTQSKLAPVVDTVVGGLQLVRTGYAVAAPDSAYDEGAPISREADAAIGIGLTALFLSSAAYGFHYTGECDHVHEHDRTAVEW